MRYVVGYQADDRGREALALATTLARTRGAELDIVMVTPPRGQSLDPYSPNRAYQTSMDEQAQLWLDNAAALVPASLAVATHLWYADSSAVGLIEAADQFEAGLIVVGAARGALLHRFTIGSVANALLHSATTPIALAPRGYEALEGISRITCATGERVGAQTLLDVAVESAAARQIELRLMSLTALDESEAERGHDRDADIRTPSLEQAQRHVDALASQTRTVLPQTSPVTTSVGHGDSVEAAITSLQFDSTELVLIGSSRLAAASRTFLGPVANKILRSLPVPMVVVPHDYTLPRGHPRTQTTDDSK